MNVDQVSAVTFPNHEHMKILLEPQVSPQYMLTLYWAYAVYLQNLIECDEFMVINLPRGGSFGTEVANQLGLTSSLEITKDEQVKIRDQARTRDYSVLTHAKLAGFSHLAYLEDSIVIPESFVDQGTTIAAVIGQILAQSDYQKPKKFIVVVPTMLRVGYERLRLMQQELERHALGTLSILTHRVIDDLDFKVGDHGNSHQKLLPLITGLTQNAISEMR